MVRGMREVRRTHHLAVALPHAGLDLIARPNVPVRIFSDGTGAMWWSATNGLMEM